MVTANWAGNTLSIFHNTVGEPLAITSITPTSGNVGTTVTITGTSFDTTPANNTVFFGATKATVTAATKTQLTVTVPAGATYGPIKVTVNNLTAESDKYFLPTFTAATFTGIEGSSNIDFTAPGSFGKVATGDLDGDGKPDLVVTVSAGTVSLYRNTSTNGTLSASSFAPKVDFAVGTTPHGVAIGDLDGDGKLDLVVANVNSSNLAVFRNTSTTGTLDANSFAAKVDFTIGTGARGVSIGDLDGDGKPEIAVGRSGVMVFRNTSTTGTIDASSFATPVTFTTFGSPYDIKIGDLDGDGKPDLATANRSGNNVSVLRNTSTVGTIDANSFATKVDFTGGDGPEDLSLGDLDGDGKLDLAIANGGNTGKSVSIYRNTSTPGTIDANSFATKIDFATFQGAFAYSVDMGDYDGDGKPDLAAGTSEA